MKLPPRSTRKGQPLAALAVLMLGWVGARAALYAGAPEATAEVPSREESAPAPTLQNDQGQTRRPQSRRDQKPENQAEPPAAPRTLLPQEPPPAPQTIIRSDVSAAHQYLFIDAVAAIPAPPPEVAAAAAAQAGSPVVPYLPAARPRALRWSADGWILWREGGNGFNLPGAGLPGASLPSGAYGSSQAGLVLRYRLAPDSSHRPVLYLRASSGLYRPRGEELAVGLAVRPLPRVPVSVMGEARVTRTQTGDVVRPAVAAVTELPPARLPGGFRIEAYGQAGWVGGKDHTPFIDGQVKLDRRAAKTGSAELRLGAGAWGGAQNGVRRLDVGPSATVDLPVGRVNTRLSADYRFRVAGDAAPGSGAAVTFSAGF